LRVYDKILPVKKKNAIGGQITSLQSQIDGKVETWYQSADPSTEWTTEALQVAHEGDLWYYTGTTTSTRTKNATYRYSDSHTWQEVEASSRVFDEIDGKAAIYYGSPSATYADAEEGDYLVDATDGCTYRRSATNQWVKVTDYAEPVAAAAKVATNYMSYNPSYGLMIADLTGEQQDPGSVSSGTRNVLVGANDVRIRNGQTVLARFGSSVYLGEEGATVQIGRDAAGYYCTIVDTDGMHVRYGGVDIAKYGSDITIGKTDSMHLIQNAEGLAFHNGLSRFFGIKVRSDGCATLDFLNSKLYEFAGAAGSEKYRYVRLLNQGTSDYPGAQVHIEAAGYNGQYSGIKLFADAISTDIDFFVGSETPKCYLDSKGWQLYDGSCRVYNKHGEIINPCSASDNLAIGYGGYADNSYDTNIYGNTVRFYSNFGFVFNSDVSAPNIGATVYHIPSGSVSCASGKFYRPATITLPSGTWIVTVAARFAAGNTNGIRRMYCTTDDSFAGNTDSAPTSASIALYDQRQPVGSGVDTITHGTVIMEGDTVLSLVAYQNSGAAVAVTGRMYAIRIK
jgi:hypothetical protein